MKTIGLKWFFVGAFTVAASLSALAIVNIPNTFTAGQPIKAVDVNDNFTAFKSSLETHDHYGQAWSGDLGFGLKVTTTSGQSALFGDNTSNASGTGVEGHANGSTAAGVYGLNPTGFGTWGQSTGGVGAQGTSNTAAGVQGTSTSSYGVSGNSSTSFGVYGFSDKFYGGYFQSQSGPALRIKTDCANNCNIIYAFGPGDSSQAEFLVDWDGNGAFKGNVTSKGVLLTSDRNAKKNFSSVNSLSILEKVARLPISSWNYKTDANDMRHIGPMAQDFHATFGLNGKDDKHISSIDEQGVALAAIQGLYQQNQKLITQLKSLEARLLKLEGK